MNILKFVMFISFFTLSSLYSYNTKRSWGFVAKSSYITGNEYDVSQLYGLKYLSYNKDEYGIFYSLEFLGGTFKKKNDNSKFSYFESNIIFGPKISINYKLFQYIALKIGYVNLDISPVTNAIYGVVYGLNYDNKIVDYGFNIEYNYLSYIDYDNINNYKNLYNITFYIAFSY